ncbi:zinc finger BED domain-containing protein 4 isoform X3 [Monodelphis domestica]|uniref:zinc finger BED domain-containing protein 4 isoform X3 n=1 Tax=Monodelphis domestica TaxID=13616 RepID=UPI0024E25F41|nr:zinc finger BED domain-containing protein 4 isoform X3 [Monodelphis domestica]
MYVIYVTLAFLDGPQSCCDPHLSSLWVCGWLHVSPCFSRPCHGRELWRRTGRAEPRSRPRQRLLAAILRRPEPCARSCPSSHLGPRPLTPPPRPGVRAPTMAFSASAQSCAPPKTAGSWPRLDAAGRARSRASSPALPHRGWPPELEPRAPRALWERSGRGGGGGGGGREGAGREGEGAETKRPLMNGDRDPDPAAPPPPPPPAAGPPGRGRGRRPPRRSCADIWSGKWRSVGDEAEAPGEDAEQHMVGFWTLIHSAIRLRFMGDVKGSCLHFQDGWNADFEKRS